MVLRFALVSLVASLGLELPETADLSRWMESSQAWLSAQVKVITDGEPNVIEVVEDDVCQPPESDRSEKAAELAKLPESAPRPGDARTIEVVDLDAEPANEPIAILPAPATVVTDATPASDAAFETIVRDLAESFASETLDDIDAFAPEAVELTKNADRIEEETINAVAEVVARETEEALNPPQEPVSTPVVVSRADRLGVAVKLTGQALQAWMGVLHQRTPMASAR